MKVLIVGDAVAPTGFSKCLHALADYLHAHNYDLLILGINYYGSEHSHPYRILPCIDPNDGGFHASGESRLPRLIFREQPDIVIILQDPWNIVGYFIEFNNQLSQLISNNELTQPEIDKISSTIFVGWLAIDSMNQQSAHNLHEYLDHIVAWTRFGAEQLVGGGWKGNTSIIPLGVDLSLYQPRDRAESRTKLLPSNVSLSDFVIGYVGRNQARKRLDHVIECFAEWTRNYNVTDAWLYLHLAPTGEGNIDIKSLCRFYGLKGKVIVSDSRVGAGHYEQDMPFVYSCMDLFVTLSQAEGWCLPALEAMACGVTVLAGNHSAIADWAKDVAILVPCSTSIVSAPMSRGTYTVGMMADKAKVVEEIDKVYHSWRGGMKPGKARGKMVSMREYYDRLQVKSLYLSSQLSWDNVGQSFDQLLKELYWQRHSPGHTNLMVTPESINVIEEEGE